MEKPNARKLSLNQNMINITKVISLFVFSNKQQKNPPLKKNGGF